MTYKKTFTYIAKLYKVKLGSYRWRSTKQNSEKENQVQKILAMKTTFQDFTFFSTVQISIFKFKANEMKAKLLSFFYRRKQQFLTFNNNF